MLEGQDQQGFRRRSGEPKRPWQPAAHLTSDLLLSVLFCSFGCGCEQATLLMAERFEELPVSITLKPLEPMRFTSSRLSVGGNPPPPQPPSPTITENNVFSLIMIQAFSYLISLKGITLLV